jgi:hypothetical protein
MMANKLLIESQIGLPASADDRQNLRNCALGLIEKLGRGDDSLIGEGLNMAQQLRDAREFDLLDQMTEQLRRIGDEDPTIRRLQAQSLIERGKAISAIDILEGSANRLSKESPEWAEAYGLMGRAWKQIFFDTTDKTTEKARKALTKAIELYRVPYDCRPTQNAWQGLNLIALSRFAQTRGLQINSDIDSQRLAHDILTTLQNKPQAERDNWYHASLAEAYLALNDLDAVEVNIRTYVLDPKTTAFALAGTLRQFTDLWLLDAKDQRERGLVQALSAALMKKDYGHLDLTSDQFRRLSAEKPSDEQLESILGPDGPSTYEWWQLGLERARAVGVICQGTLARIGTCFLIRGGDFKGEWGDEVFVLTNAHVVSNDPKDGGLAPEEACVKFEPVDKNKSYDVDGIVWSSPKTELDTAILRLKQPIQGIKPLVNTVRLPILDGRQRVYVIGYPSGRAPSFSFQDNLLLDHEGPTDGMPVDPSVCHIQYRAPTEGGSSGSPVFNASAWQVIALHHAGGQAMRRLNGKVDKWPANEGIWIKSISAPMALDDRTLGN